MNARPGIRALGAAVALALAFGASATAFERRVGAEAREREATLRTLRAELQRVERARVLLEGAPERGRALRASPDEVRVAILEAVESLARARRVALLGHALRAAVPDPHGSDTRQAGRWSGASAGAGGDEVGAHALRLTLELEAVHAVRLLDALATLAGALPGRPVDVAGCRVDHAPGGASGATARVAHATGATDGETGSLVASCALDWHWWPT